MRGAATDGLAADTLTLTVGYFGGPYYDKKTFTVDELWAMDVQYVEYTVIDNMPSVVIEHAAGVTLADLLDAAGIDLGSAQSFNFWTNDKEGGYYNSFTKSSLVDTPRYCYYSLPDNFDYDYGRGNELATADKARVPAMIALADDWKRALAGASFGSDYMGLNESTRFRLVYGQTDAVTRTASDSAKWISKIEVTLGGAPTLTMDASALELTVGSRFRSIATVSAADPAIAANAGIGWESSDAGVATVDADGEISVHAEGSATITARYAGQSVSVLVRGTAAPSPDAGTGGMSGQATDGGGGDADAVAPSAVEPPGPLDEADAAAVAAAQAAQGETAALPAQDAVAPGPQPPREAARIAMREVSILPAPLAASLGDEGGVQNWRRDEMAAGAVELPAIPQQIRLGYIAATIAIFILGGIWEYARFRLP
jgi:hypothetical protein